MDDGCSVGDFPPGPLAGRREPSEPRPPQRRWPHAHSEAAVPEITRSMPPRPARDVPYAARAAITLAAATFLRASAQQAHGKPVAWAGQADGGGWTPGPPDHRQTECRAQALMVTRTGESAVYVRLRCAAAHPASRDCRSHPWATSFTASKKVLPNRTVGSRTAPSAHSFQALTKTMRRSTSLPDTAATAAASQRWKV